MKRLLNLLLLTLIPAMGLMAQEPEELTFQAAKTLYKNVTKKRISIHDPSVVWEPTSKRYYIFGSHKAGAYSTDLQNWTQANPTWRTTASSNAANKDAFVTPAVKTVMKGGAEVSLPAFNAVDWSARTDADYNVDGNMWAPDVIWNPVMQKWCMYLSINGDAWHSSIVLLTATSITGPYQYQGPVVICGFDGGSHSYKDTDLELVVGTQSSLPSRYNMGSKWGNRWPHTIDPAVFYDEEGKLWLVYGSWSGGIWMLELNEETGLRDYDVSYPSTNGSSDAVTSDPYFGKKVAGGRYVSGEGPYIEHIGNYYYLFVSYGFYSPDGGYEMRVFRSSKPDGPYVDAQNRSAIYSTYAMNYGKNGDQRGEKIMGSYNQWGSMTVGECAQGHNSIIAAEDGRTYLVYHTKFNDGTAGHQVRTHQVFVNKDGWLVAAPFEYNGETATDALVATQQSFSALQMAGTYQVLIHKYGMDYANYEEVTPIQVTLDEDGKVTGDRTGTWSMTQGSDYITLTMAGVTYNGVVLEEQMDGQSLHAIAITACSRSGVNVWAYKLHPKYALAWQLNNQKLPLSNNQNVAKNIDLYSLSLGLDDVSLQWTSSEPAVISDYGRYNPMGLENDIPVSLTARLMAANYFWTQTFNVKALSETNSQSAANWKDGLKAHYGFDDEALANTLDANQQARLQRNGTTALPTLVSGDPLRNGNVLHLSFGANGKESYVSIPNPLYGEALTDGATLSFWVKRTDDNLWDALYGFNSGNARLYMTGNLYTGFNDGAGHWLDINHPNTVTPDKLGAGRWHQVTITFSRKATSSGGINVYIDGSRFTGDKFNGELDGKKVTAKTAFEYDRILDHIAASEQLTLGYGSFWGSPDASFDDVMLYNRVLSLSEVLALNQMVNRVTDYSTLVSSGIADVKNESVQTEGPVYTLSGMRVGRTIKGQPKGIYLVGGRKVVVR